MPSVVKIGKRAFQMCRKLEQVTFSENISFVANNAFSSTPWLDNFPGKFLIIGGHILFKYKGTARHIKIPANVTRIEKYAFEGVGAQQLRSVVMHDTITEIAGNPFFFCSHLGVIWYVSDKCRVGLPVPNRGSVEQVLRLFTRRTQEEHVKLLEEFHDPITQAAFSIFLIRQYDAPAGWEHFRCERETCMRIMVGYGDIENLQFFLDRREVDRPLLEELLEHAIMHRQLEAQTLLMHYKHTIIGYPSGEDMFRI